MIGQHIYSRCLEGYFSRSSMNADSTTVTISIDMFAKEEQAKNVARECETISALEDVRPVPTQVQGAYRGVLKIRRLNRQLSVVCRSYRLHSDMGNGNGFGGGESRDFTYSSSYILAGEDKEDFFKSPEYALNLQNFEPYPSVMKRIEMSRANGRNGRIEANPDYSLFAGECKTTNLDIFVKAGFTEGLFVDYISSILERVAYAGFQGHEKGKVLVVLPRQFNPSWMHSGGNIYAEQVMLATLKILPSFVRTHVNATTGGLDTPDAFVLEGYQLVFMESGSAKDWKGAEYSIIDLDRGTSRVTSGLDKSYAQFLWNHLTDEASREDFERKYAEMFGEERIEDGDNFPDKLGYILKIWNEEQTGFADPVKRVHYTSELIHFSDDVWTERAEKLVSLALRREVKEPTYDKRLEADLRGLIQSELCPSGLKDSIIKCLINYVVKGDADEETVLHLSDSLQNNDLIIEDNVIALNRYLSSNPRAPWYERESVFRLYLDICENDQIPDTMEAKKGAIRILENWYRSFIQMKNWDKAVHVLQVISVQLDHPQITEERREEIYEDMLRLLFYSNGETRQKAADLIKGEQKIHAGKRECEELFWECFVHALSQRDVRLHEDIVWQLAYYAVARDQAFLEGEWKDTYASVIQRFAAAQPEMVFRGTKSALLEWVSQANSEARRNLAREALILFEKTSLRRGASLYRPEMRELNQTLQVLEAAGRGKEASELLYMRYRCNDTQDSAKQFFVRDLDRTQQWKILLCWILNNEKDPILETVLPKFSGQRKEFRTVLQNFSFTSDEEAARTAQVYFSLMQGEVKDKGSVNGNLLQDWCALYKGEMTEIRNLNNEAFTNAIRTLFLDELKNMNPAFLYDLDRVDIEFLKEMGAENLGDNWSPLNLLYSIYHVSEGLVSEEFYELRNRIIREVIDGNDSRKAESLYNALGRKREELCQSSANKGNEGEVLFNIALLEDQLLQYLRRKDFNLSRVVRKIYGTMESGKEPVYTALRLMGVIGSYEDYTDPGVFESRAILRPLAQSIVETANLNPDVLCDNQIGKAYRRLSSTFKLQLNQMGLKRALQEVPEEYLNAYGLKANKSKSNKIVPIVLGVVFGLLGIGAVAALYLFGDQLGTKTILIAGGAAAGTGLLGNLIAFVVALVSREQKKGLVNSLYTVFTILGIVGLCFAGVAFLNQSGLISQKNDEITAVEKEITDVIAEKEKIQKEIEEVQEAQAEEQRRLEEEAKRKAQIEKYGEEGMEELKGQIEQILAASPATWSVYVRDINNNRFLLHNNHRAAGAVNLFGWYILDSAYEGYVLGYGTEKDPSENAGDFMSGVMNGEEEPTNAFLAAASNAGTLDGGKEMVQAFFDHHDMTDSGFGDNMQQNYTSAQDLGLFLKSIYDANSSSRMGIETEKNILNTREKSRLLVQGIPEGSGAAMINQTSAVDMSNAEGPAGYATLADGAIVYGPEGYGNYIVCVLAENVTDKDGVKAVMGEVSKAVYDYFITPSSAE